MSITELRAAYAQEPPSLVVRLRAFVALTKPRIIELLLVTTVPTMFLAARHLPSIRLIVLTLIGGTLAAGGANAMNMVYDRDIDSVMERTKRRPLVTGTVSPREAMIFAIALELASFFLFWRTVNLISGVLAVSATLFYVLVYTMWLKRISPQNIVIGGAAGAVPVLVGWTAVRGHLDLAPFILFAIIFFWTPPHFWALAMRYRDDYERARVPMLPVVRDTRNVVRQIVAYTIVLFGLSIALAPIAHLGVVFGCIAGLLGLTFLLRAIGLSRDPSPKHAMKVFHFSITYLTVLFIAMGITAIVLHP